MHISIAYGTVWTEAPIATVQSADGSTIDLTLHYDSGKADGSVARRQTVLGYGWTHNYNIHLLVRLRDVLMPDATGRLTRFRERLDGGYTPSDGHTHTLSRVDASTFLLEKVDGRRMTFQLFDPPPWPEAAEVYQLTRIEDAEGRVTTLSYNGQGLLVTITDPYGRAVGLTYNLNGRIDTVTNADTQVTQIEYAGADDDLWRITDPLVHTLEYTYDPQNRMTVEKLKDGNTWTAVYANGKPYQLKDGAGQVYVTLTNPANWAIDEDHVLQFGEVRYIPSQTTVTDGCGGVTIHHYDLNGYITLVEDPTRPDKTYVYNVDLRLTQRCDEANNCFAYEYDGDGNRTKATDPLGNQTQMFYAHAIPSLLTTRIEPDGDAWSYEYDALGNLTKEIDPIVEAPTDRVITYGYTYYVGPPDGRIQTKTRTDRNGHTTQWDYNPDGTLARETVDPVGLALVTSTNTTPPAGAPAGPSTAARV